MGNNDIKVKDLSTTSSLSTDNKLMLLTDEANNTVQNITVENALANIISSNANNSLSVGSDKKLYTRDISGEVGDLDNLITTNKTDIVSAINEVKGDTNAITGEVVSASKGWLEEGKIYQKSYWYGEKLYNDVYKYNHSKFDLSKFAVVGSPIITDDGIASGFSNTGTNIVPTGITLTATDNFHIHGEFTLNDLTNLQNILGIHGTNANIFIELRYDQVNKRMLLLYENTNSSNIAQAINSISANVSYIYDIIVNGSNITFKLNGETIGTDTDFVGDTSTAINIGRGQAATYPLYGSIDLKQFSITVDGYPVFNGNKTGIDTIKSDNYTVVGSPTISADGIASGFSSSNKISASLTLSGTKIVAQAGFFYKVPSASGSVIGLFNGGTSCGRCYVSTSGNIVMNAPNNNSDYISIGSSDLTLTANDFIIATLELTENSTFKLTVLDTNTNETITKTSTANWNKTVDEINSVYFGSSGSSEAYEGSIDLNAFKIYVDGDLVYQPCLLIPYNESLTGSKIVDVAYRDRVIDVYEQFGSANYYTIDETNQNATLPMGEVYGFIEQKQNSIGNIFEKVVPAYGQQGIGIYIQATLSAYTVPDDGFVYSDCITLHPGDIFLLSIIRNGQSSSLINIQTPPADNGGLGVVQFPFFFPVLKDDVVETGLTLSTLQALPIMYFVHKEGV